MIDQFDQFLPDMYGNRCSTFQPQCIVCEAWGLRDAWVEYLETTTRDTE